MRADPLHADDLFDARRHEALTATPWREAAARAAIERICGAAEDEFDEAEGSWRLHPQDDPPPAGARSYNVYWGAAGVVWALRHLAAQGAVKLRRDYTAWIERYPQRVAIEAAGEAHGTASYLFGESAPLLLAWRATRRQAYADRLYDVVQGNVHNAAREPLWGNAGTMLAALHCAEAPLQRPEERRRWQGLVQHAARVLVDEMVFDTEAGGWLWEQDLYGTRCRYLGAAHGMTGNAFAVLRAGDLVDRPTRRLVEERTLQTLAATALRAEIRTAEGDAVRLVNWHPFADAERIAASLAKGARPLVQDCHGAPGIVCRLAGVGHGADELLRAAGEMTWYAGPLAKGPSLCHGTAGSAMACLKLWRRFGEARWLERARRLALHAAEQVQAARAKHGQGRHSLWTGDLGVACTLWNCVREDDGFPTLDCF